MPRPSKAAGSVALVTGANRGIGLAFVAELAARGAQVPSLAGIEERAREHGVRIAVQTKALGRNIVQFHPLDVGVLLELDEFLPRTAWFWDDLELPTQTPAGAEIAFASRTVRFVPATGGRTGMVAIDMHATDREHGTGRQGELCHTLIRFV